MPHPMQHEYGRGLVIVMSIFHPSVCLSVLLSHCVYIAQFQDIFIRATSISEALLSVYSVALMSYKC